MIDERFNRQAVLNRLEHDFPADQRAAILAELDRLSTHDVFQANPVILAQVQLAILVCAGTNANYILNQEYMANDWRDLIVIAGCYPTEEQSKG